MKELDERFFGSWAAIIAMAIMFGCLFTLAGGLVQQVTGGERFLTTQTVFLGALAAVAFVWAGARVRKNMDEESEG